MQILINTDAIDGEDTGKQKDNTIHQFNLFSCSILIVDDDLSICELIKIQLKAAGFENIHTAADGRTGLEQINDLEPDLVILDIEMPGVNGIDVLKKIRRNSYFDDMPVIVETGHNHIDFRNEVLRAGATNIVSKPLDFGLLLDRVKTHLEHQLLMKSLKAYQQRLQQELAAARSMQLQLLPREVDIQRLRERYGVKLDWYYQPSSELSGDCWGIHQINDQKFGVFIFDFTGHGVGAAVNTFRLHTVMKDVRMDVDSPARYLETLNNQLISLIPRGQFATMNYSVIDVENNTLTYASAGHTAPIYGGTSTKEISAGDPAGMPLGINKSATYIDHKITLDRDNFLFLYSDALIETPGENAPPLEDKGLLELVNTVLSEPEDKRPLEWLLNKFHARSSTLPQDDVTAVWIQR